MAMNNRVSARPKNEFVKPTLIFKPRGSYDFKPSIINIQEYIKLVYTYLSREVATKEEKMASQIFTKTQEVNLALVETSTTKKGLQIAQYNQTLSTRFNNIVVGVMASDSRNIITPFSFSFNCNEDERTQIVAAMKAIDDGWKAPKKGPTKNVTEVVSNKVEEIHRVHAHEIAKSPIEKISDSPITAVSPVDSLIQLSSRPPQHNQEEISSGSPLLDYINGVALPGNDKINNIPDNTLASILYHIRNSQDVVCIDPTRKLYFVPDTLMQSVLRGGDLHGLTGDYLTESAILQNIPHALKQKGGAFLTVFRINVDLFEAKKLDYKPARIEQIELLTATPKVHITEVQGVRYNFIQHNLETVQIAIGLTNEGNEGKGVGENLLNFYGAINRGDAASNKTLIKGHCLVLPEGFNIDEIMNDIHSKMTDTELVGIVMKLKMRGSELKSAIDTQQTMLDVLNQKCTSLNDTIKSRSANLSSLEGLIEKLQKKDVLSNINGDEIKSMDLGVRFNAMNDTIMLLQAHMREISLIQATRDSFPDERDMILDLENQMVALEGDRSRVSSEMETLNQGLAATNKDLGKYAHIVQQKLAMLQGLMD